MDYLSQAEDCVLLADKMRTPEGKRQLTHMAGLWRKLARREAAGDDAL
jgi:hypothetical protein